jgi:flagellar hook-basal body complex protein FliE
MIDYVQSVAAADLAPAGAKTAGGVTGNYFGDWLTQQIDTLNQQLTAGDMEVRKLALGDGGNIHEVMMRLETAKLSFELAVQVRNKLLEAYQDILRMQL